MELPIAPVLLLDFAVAWVVFEAFIQVIRYRRHGRPQWAVWSLANAAAGLMLLLTARAALADAGQWIFLLCLAGALLAHLAELALRPADKPGSEQTLESD